MSKNEEAMLDECLNAVCDLTSWEIDFIENLDRNFRDRPLSERQIEVLERINGKIL